MPAVSILKILLELAKKVASYVRDKQLMEAGAAQAILRGVNDANDAIDRADNARRNYDSLPVESDPENRDNRK